MTNLLDNTRNQPSNFRTTNCVKINVDSRGTYNTNIQIKFKASVKLKSSFCNYSDENVLVKGTKLVATTVDTEVISKMCSVY